MRYRKVDEDEKHRAYLTPGSFEYIGIIEVVVLRCQDAYAGISKSASPIARRDSMTSGGRHWNDGPQPAERHEDPVSPMKRSTTHEEGFLSGLFDGCGDTYRWDASKQSQEVRTTRNSSYESKSQGRHSTSVRHLWILQFGKFKLSQIDLTGLQLNSLLGWETGLLQLALLLRS